MKEYRIDLCKMSIEPYTYRDLENFPEDGKKREIIAVLGRFYFALERLIPALNKITGMTPTKTITSAGKAASRNLSSEARR